MKNNSSTLIIKKTKRLILRPIEKEDHEAWVKANLDSLPKQNVWDREKKDKKQLKKSVFYKFIKLNRKEKKEGVTFHFGIFRKKDQAFLGSISLMDISRGIFQNAYLGYIIYNQHWGQGYAKEAGKAILEIAFKDLNLHRVEAAIDPKNKASLAVAKSIGLKKEYLCKRRLYIEGAWKDFMLYAGTSEDFGYKWKAPKKHKVRF